MQLVDSLVYMPMIEIPGFVVKHLFYRIQPMVSVSLLGKYLIFESTLSACTNLVFNVDLQP